MSTSWNSEDWFWKRTALYSAIAVAVVAAAGGAWYYFAVLKQEPAPQETAPVAEAPEAPEVAPSQPDHHPIPEPRTPREPLPPLAKSDEAVARDLSKAVGPGPIERLLVPQNLIRHIVVTIDNLPRHKVAEQMRPLKPLGGQAITTTSGDTILLSEENFARYAPLMQVLDKTDVQQLGEVYIRYYPLFQEAYEDLGYPGQYFNDRLVEVIDHLLQTPTVKGPIELRQGRVFYEYADPALEARSAGQKMLLRMGPDNTARIKKKLQALRAFVTTSHADEIVAPDEGEGSEDEALDPMTSGSAEPAQPDSMPEAQPD